MSGTLSSRDWFGKSVAAVLLGFLLGIGISGLWGWLGIGGITGGPAKMQLNMWMVSPVWALTCAFVFFFPSTRAAWGWLALMNAIVWAPVLAAQFLLR
ncbi:hypothetical protein L6Q21_06745 [Sandaracinobacter sp. RS1-74]|uniref:hypothetical protein n=1 Tax=Sandaracinobacteroides sayramensis TaxID=2913411 RepID=UPI001EDB476A|nr:hypothetical protein [Sandaracinobacteroides sayramensis]MCG2840672.1 hypothetical protein [Sandaracinobacteroides sayramensis]